MSLTSLDNLVKIGQLKKEARDASEFAGLLQAIIHTTGLSADIGRILDQCHNKRNLAEYEGFLDISQQLLTDLLSATEKLLEKVKHFPTGEIANG